MSALSVVDSQTLAAEIPSAAPATVEVVDLVAEVNNPLSVIRSEWQTLFDEDPNATIFQHPEYVNCLLGCLSKSKLPCLMLLARRQGRLVGFGALFPRVSTSRLVSGVGPSWNIHGFRLVSGRFLGSQGASVEHSLLEAAMLEVNKHDARFLSIEDLDQSSTLASSAQGLKARGFGIYSPTSLQVRLKIRLPPTAEDYWSQFTAKSRYTFRRLERKLGDFRIVRFTSVDHVADFLEDANRISLKTWQTEQLGLRIKNDDFERGLYTLLALQGALRSYILYFGETPVAFVVGTQFRGVFRYDEIGFDRQFHALSPGRVLLIKILEDVYARDTPQWFDFGMGDADYKRQFANHEGQSGNVWILPPGIYGKGIVAYLNGSRVVRQCGRQLIKVLGWYRRLRQKARLGAAVDAAAKGHTPETSCSAETQSQIVDTAGTSKTNQKG